MTAGTRTEQEVASQPACWRQAARLADGLAGLLPARGERVAVAGCGTSWFMAQSYAAAREEAGHGETDAFAASEMPAGRRYDRVLLLCRSGTTTEILQLLGRLRGRPCPRSRSPRPGGPRWPRRPTRSSSWASRTRNRWCRPGSPPPSWPCSARTWAHDPGLAADAAERVLAAPVPPELLAARQFTFLGTGWTYGLANEAALKLREAAGMWTEAYPAMEYRHGPVAVTGERSVVWLFGPPPDGLAGRSPRRRHRLARRGGPAGRAGPGARLAIGAGAGARARPGPAAEPDPVRHPHAAERAAP